MISGMVLLKDVYISDHHETTSMYNGVAFLLIAAKLCVHRYERSHIARRSTGTPKAG